MNDSSLSEKSQFIQFSEIGIPDIAAEDHIHKLPPLLRLHQSRVLQLFHMVR